MNTLKYFHRIIQFSFLFAFVLTCNISYAIDYVDVEQGQTLVVDAYVGNPEEAITQYVTIDSWSAPPNHSSRNARNGGNGNFTLSFDEVSGMDDELGLTDPTIPVTVTLDENCPLGQIILRLQASASAIDFHYVLYINVVPRPTPSDPLVWSPDTAIDGGDVVSPLNNIVPVGTEVQCEVSEASDSDRWTQGSTFGDENDGITYLWSANGGSFPDGVTSRITKWIAPQEPGTYTLTCRINDSGVTPPGDDGSRDDELKLKTIIIRVVKADTLQYRLSNEDNFENVPNPLLVPLNQTVEFKVNKNSEAPSWPTSKPVWGGTAGATGNSETKSVTFDTQSTTATDYKTVTVECGNTLTANVIVYTLSFKTRRKGSEDEFGSTAKVAAGAKSSDEHKGELQVQSAPAIAGIPVGSVTIKSGGLGATNSVTATASLDSSTTDGNGQITGTFTSGNRVQTTEVELNANPTPRVSSLLTVSYNQVWNELSGGTAWTYDPYFEYDEPSTLSYEMLFNSEVPITTHVMEFETLTLDGFEWDPNEGDDWDDDGFPDGDYVPATYSSDDIDTTKFDTLSALVEYSSVSETPAGTYNTDQTIVYDEDFIIDYVEFQIVDTHTYDATGQ